MLQAHSNRTIWTAVQKDMPSSTSKVSSCDNDNGKKPMLVVLQNWYQPLYSLEAFMAMVTKYG